MSCGRIRETMPRAIWTGALSFGLVNVPIRVVTATQEKDVRFNQLHAKDASRIEMKRFCAEEGIEIPYDEIVKGYHLGGDEYVTFSSDEIKDLSPSKTDTVDIIDFVSLHDIDPIYYNKTYFLTPQKGASKAYGLLLEAMRTSDRVAIARVVMRTKEYLVAIRPIGSALSMTTLLYHDEVVKEAALELPEVKAVEERELAMAQQLIDTLTTDFDPARYKNDYQERLVERIEAKAEGREVVAAPSKAPAVAATSLVDALTASLNAAKARREAGDGASA